MKAKSKAWGLSEDTWIGVGVPPGSYRHRKVTVVGHGHGVTLAFGRKDETNSLNIYLEPEDARAIGKELIKKADFADTFPVMERLRNERRWDDVK